MTTDHVGSCGFFSQMTRIIVLTFCWDKLSDGQRSSASRLHKLHLGHDDVVLQHGAARHADGVAPRMIHIDVRAAAVLAHLGAHGVKVSKPDGERKKQRLQREFRQQNKLYSTLSAAGQHAEKLMDTEIKHHFPWMSNVKLNLKDGEKKSYKSAFCCSFLGFALSSIKTLLSKIYMINTSSCHTLHTYLIMIQTMYESSKIHSLCSSHVMDNKTYFTSFCV